MKRLSTFDVLRLRGPIARAPSRLRPGALRRAQGAGDSIRRALLAPAACIALLASSGQAQDDDAAPPRVLELGDVQLEDPPRDEVEGVALIAEDGAATLESCDAEEDLCAAFAEVLARARFEPARRGDRPVAARVRVRTRVVALARAPGEVPAGEPEDDVAPRDAPILGVRAEVSRPPAGTRRLELVELRDLPGALGDPFRVLEAMPGVVPLASGVPYYYVRGAPPAGTLYVYDGIQLPILFHLGVGPAVVHPRMLGPLRLHAGAAPARYGRMVGGVITTEAVTAPVERAAAEVELRLLDVNGYVEAPLQDGEGSLRAALRWGWPALIAGLVVGGSELFYGDYQARVDLALSPTDRVQLVALGSYDNLSFTFDTGTPSTTEIHFQRLELRLLRRLDRFEIGVALRAAYDRTLITGTGTINDPLNLLHVSIEAATFGPRLWASLREGDLRLDLGGEIFGTVGRPDGRLGTIPGLPLRASPLFTGASTRSVAAAWLELGFPIDRALELELGGRFDIWLTGNTAEGALDPRLRATWHVMPELDLHAGAGVARQPAVFYLPMPGLSQVSLEHGLQTAIQSDVGALVKIGAFEGELALFLHHYDGLMFTDAYVLADAARNICGRPGGACVDVEPEPRTSGLAWGGELFLRIAPEQKLSGWISYTLSWIELEPVLGLPYRPSFDVRHVLNVVARWEILPGFTAGARVFLRSGSPHGAFWVSERDRTLHRHTQELDPFFRGDASVAYAWDAGWARLRVSLEWLNVTIASEPFGLECRITGPVNGACPVRTAPPIFAPNLGIRGDFR